MSVRITIELGMNILLLLLGLGLILVGANFLTDGSASLAARFRVSEFVIGLTIVAVGTSTPELVVSVLSAIGGQSDVAIGNVVGSNIFNVFVILGLCALVRPLPLSRGNIRRDIPIGLGASLLLLAFTVLPLPLAGHLDRIARWEGVVMLLLYVGLTAWMIRAANRSASLLHAVADPAADRRNTLQATSGRPGGSVPRDAAGHGPHGANGLRAGGPTSVSSAGSPERKDKALWLLVVMILGGLAGLVVGGELFLRSATRIARHLGVAESVIAITLVAGGTSLPELASSLVSVIKGKPDMALGNIVGSNIANILMILGLSATIRPLAPGGITLPDILMVVLGSLLLLLTAFTFRRRAIDRWEGALFLLIYGGYLWWLLAG